jgi:hypothetical protein
MKNAGYSDEVINARFNLVRVPTLKHHELTRWFQTPNKEFGWMTPRKYLEDKPLEERLRVGDKALIEFGILKP